MGARDYTRQLHYINPGTAEVAKYRLSGVTLIIMQWNERVAKRRSVRKYKNTSVTDDRVLKVLEAA